MKQLTGKLNQLSTKLQRGARLLQGASYVNRSTVSLGKPCVFQIEATNYCNLRCPMCPHDLMQREVGHMGREPLPQRYRPGEELLYRSTPSQYG